MRVPSGQNVRPTQDRVREALFSIIAPAIAGSAFLDLFAGTGVVGLDAFSRGAAQITWIEKDRKACQTLSMNVAALGCDTGRLICSDTMVWLKGQTGLEQYDFVFADPPYEWAVQHGFGGIMACLRQNKIIRDNGLFMAERATRREVEDVPGWQLWRDRSYGKTQLLIYRLDEREN